MYYTVTKEAVNALMSMPGEISGSVLRKDKQFIVSRGGSKKVAQAEEEMVDMGHFFRYKDIKSSVFYPWGKRVVSLLAIATAFNMDQDRVREIGEASTEISSLKAIFNRYFKNTEQLLQEVCQDWRKNNTVGRVELKEFDAIKKRAVVALYNLDFHPIFCDYFCGYLTKVAQSSEGRKVTCKEERCYFNGNCDFHEFIIKWE